MKIKGLKTFLPSIDFELSKQFYLDLGFNINWQGDELIEFGSKEYNFYLQKYYVKEWADNLMMQLFVEDLDKLYKVAEHVNEKYEATKLKPIFIADYGRTFHIIGPAGELWHMTEITNDKDIEHNKIICEDE